MRAIIDPRLRASLDNFYESRCTIQLAQYVQTAANQKVLDPAQPWVNVVGMVNLLCRLSPLIEIRPTDNEQRSADMLSKTRARQCKLQDYFPAIQVRDMRAVVDGEAYSIVGVEHDGSKFTTRLRLEILLP